jgi:hypothetical protein
MTLVPNIYRSSYFEVDGPMGTEVVPCDLVHGTFMIPQKPGPVPAALQPFCENGRFDTIHKRDGWVCRMEEVGGMYTTPWQAFRSMEDAVLALLEDEEVA